MVEFDLGVNFLERDLAVDRIERDNIVAFIIDAIDPLFLVLAGVMFDTHFVLFDQDTFFDAVGFQQAFELFGLV